MRTLTLALATLSTGLVAGLFYGFEVAVNPAFRLLPDAAYVAAMQAINDVIQNPVFALSFFGAPLLLPAAAVLHGRRPRSRRLGLLVAATGLYVVGSLGVTMAANIPLNDALAAVPRSASPTQLRTARHHFAASWNHWHQVRTLASLLAFGLTVTACLRADRPANAS